MRIRRDLLNEISLATAKLVLSRGKRNSLEFLVAISSVVLQGPRAARGRRATRSFSREVIYWRTIWSRVVIRTTHLRTAKWPLHDFGSRKRDNKFQFAACTAPSAFNLTGRNHVTLVRTRQRKARPIRE